MAEAKQKRFDLSKVALPNFKFKEVPVPNGILVLALVICAFLLGMLTNKVTILEKQVGTPSTTTATTTVDPAAAGQPVQPTANIETIKALFDSGKHITFGDANNKNLIVEVADPSCPYCQAAGGLNPELNAQIGPQFTPESEGGTYVAPVLEIEKLVEQGEASFVWIYFPGHGNGEMGTKALYCAHDQGKFWPVHNKLMTKEGHDLLEKTVTNDTTKSQELVDFLSGAADTGALKECIDSGKYDNRLTEDQAVATTLGIQGTPGFYVNETSFPGAYSWKDMESALK
ncbi:MAG TPA: DsbA family protein [Patescibacteria group bacterium]|nr:DsbA family protein [Patescibacteria group bacterium]